MKEKLYNFFVRKHSGIRYEYERYVQEHLEEHYESRGKHIKILLKLNWHYRVKRAKTPLIYHDHMGYDEAGGKTGKAKKSDKRKVVALPYLQGAESRSRRWIAPQDFVRMLMDYDVISFDIFDTLVFRPFDKPGDIFQLIGARLDILDFVTIRTNAEKKVREENFEKYAHREAPIEEIYKKIEEEIGLNAEVGMKCELEVEESLLTANPYIKYVFDTIKAQGKRIILVSDMYISKNDLQRMLAKCGYEGYEEMFISCEYRCSKRQGELYQVVKNYIGNEDIKIVHVGDNPTSDIRSAEENGIAAILYENVNSMGKAYRATDMSILVGGAYRGIVNRHLHNGYKRYDAHYEYGFIYGGLFMFGYAQYIHKYAVEHKMDKVLFVARDGYIIKQVYDMLFSDIKSEYLLSSRISNLKMAAYCSKQDFLKEFVLRWVKEKKNISLRDVMDNMELSDMMDILPSDVELDECMNEENTQVLYEAVCDNWERVTKKYERHIEVGYKYYRNFFEGAKKVLVVDIGWRGQGVIALRSLERDYWHFGCEIYGMLAGSAPTRVCNAQLQSGILDAYMFSPIKNRPHFAFHSKNSINNILTELFAGAPSPSFKGITENEDDYAFAFDVPETSNYEMIGKVHKGIIDFAKIYAESFEKYPFMYNISGEDAYMPIKHIFKDYSFIKRFFAKYEFQDCVGGTSGEKSRTIRDVFRKFKL